MTRQELIDLVLRHARSNGFQFRRWYTGHLGRPWTGAVEALEALSEERRYYALLFSHEFARCFWKAGAPMTFLVPAQEFARQAKDGTVRTVVRKGYTRRITRDDAWLYHVREMALAEEPLRYIRRFLPVIEELAPEPQDDRPSPDPRFIVDEEDLLSDDDQAVRG